MPLVEKGRAGHRGHDGPHGPAPRGDEACRDLSQAPALARVPRAAFPRFAPRGPRWAYQDYPPLAETLTSPPCLGARKGQTLGFPCDAR